MTEPYTHSDTDRCTLTVEPIAGGTALTAHDPSDNHEVIVHVRGSALDELVTAMYAAAGRKVIILPDVNWYGTDRTAFAFNGIRITRNGKTITLPRATVNAVTARGLAAVLAGLADAADSEPDPAELAALAEQLRTWAAQNNNTVGRGDRKSVV